MSKTIAKIDILTDTFESHILRTNDIIDALGSEVITANSTQATTGSTASPKHAKLFGSFTANTLATGELSLGTLTANSSEFNIDSSVKFKAGGAAGAAGQVLVSDGTGLTWDFIAGQGTVTQIANGAGIVFTNVAGKAYDSPITSYGTINLKAGDGIVLDARGISINTTFVSTYITNAQFLQGKTWAAPAAIGTTTANTGSFTGVTASPIEGYRLRGEPDFLISNNIIQTTGRLDVTTPYIASAPNASTGGVRVRGQRTSGGVAYIQVTDQYGSAEWGYFKAHANGYCVWSGSLSAGAFSDLIPAGTRMLFAQANAPTGWTKVTDHNDKALRVVNGTGGGSSGTTSFTSAFNTAFSTDGHVLSETEMPAHTHYGTVAYTLGGTHNNGFEEGRGSPDWTVGSMGATGGNMPHSHTLSMDLAYVDVIIASKN